MDAITFTDVTKSYGDVLAVDGLSLDVSPGRTVALLGPNGAGKFTSINMLLGLVRATSGEIRVFGDSPGEAVAKGRIGAMLQESALIPELTVGETVESYAVSTRTRCRSTTSSGWRTSQIWSGDGRASCPAGRRSGCGSPSPSRAPRLLVLGRADRRDGLSRGGLATIGDIARRAASVRGHGP